jgi:hypothetical protein
MLHGRRKMVASKPSKFHLLQRSIHPTTAADTSNQFIANYQCLAAAMNHAKNRAVPHGYRAITMYQYKIRYMLSSSSTPKLSCCTIYQTWYRHRPWELSAMANAPTRTDSNNFRINILVVCFCWEMDESQSKVSVRQ